MLEEAPRVNLFVRRVVKHYQRQSKQKHWLSMLLLPLLIIGIIFASPIQSQAASGGRMGGGSFRSPSMPRTGGFRDSGGFRGGYGGYRNYGGGMGFPFILPFFGFGGGGLFGFLVLMSIAGVLVNALRGNNYSSSINTTSDLGIRNDRPVKMIQLQVGLLASAKQLQEDLRKIANTADTNSKAGLQKILQETTLALLRQPNLWVYANLEKGEVPFNTSESTFNRLSMVERSKLKAELTSNIEGQILSINSEESQVGEADSTSEFIAITLLIACQAKSNINTVNNSDELKESLRIIGSISSSELLALEVIWQPDGEGDVLSAEELVTAYPNLKHL